MSYIIYTSSGTLLTTIPTGKINTSTTSLDLIGRDVPNYGRYQNQNLVNLLSNFANSANKPPRAPLVGQLWYDTTYRKLKVFNDSGFELIGSAVVSSSQPIGQEPGEFWIDRERKALNFMDNEGQYQTITSFPRNKISGWQFPLTPVYDNSTATVVKDVTLLRGFGQVLGTLSTSTFVASSEDSFTVFANAGTSQYEVTEGLTIIGNVRATKTVEAITGTFVSGSIGELTLGHHFTEVTQDLSLNVPDKATVIGFSTTSTPIHVVLPAPSAGKYLIIKDEGGHAEEHPIVIVPASTATTAINGDCFEIQINTDYGSCVLYSDGSNWFTVGDTYNFSLSTLQEGNGVTSITGHHDNSTGVGLTSESWAQLMWAPSTEFITTTEIADGGTQYNWVYTSGSGFTVQNHNNTTDHKWNFKTDGLLQLPGATTAARPVLGDTFGDGGVTLRSPQHKYSELGSYDGNAYLWVGDAGYEGVGTPSEVYVDTNYTGAGNRWKFGADGLLNFPDTTQLGQTEGSNTFGFYSDNTNIQYLLEAGSVTWNFNASTKTLELPNGAKIVSADVTQVSGMSADVNYYNYDASSMTVAVTPGKVINFPNFSGQILINDHIDGQVELWLAGGAYAYRLGTSKTGNGEQTLGTMTFNSGIHGYTWTSSITGTMVFVATRTRAEA